MLKDNVSYCAHATHYAHTRTRTATCNHTSGRACAYCNTLKNTPEFVGAVALATTTDKAKIRQQHVWIRVRHVAGAHTRMPEFTAVCSKCCLAAPTLNTMSARVGIVSHKAGCLMYPTHLTTTCPRVCVSAHRHLNNIGLHRSRCQTTDVESYVETIYAHAWRCELYPFLA